MGDESLIITIMGAVVTTIISTVVLRSLKFFEKKQDAKAQEIKESAANAAEQARISAARIAEEVLKRQDERSNLHLMSTNKMAEDLKYSTEQRDEKLSRSLKESTEKIATELRDDTQRIAEDLQKKNDRQSKIILDKITDVDSTLTKMIESLQQGAELTNNNVSNIRRDMLELQEDIDNIYDKINAETADKDPGLKAERDRKRKIRRKEINNDSLVYDSIDEDNSSRRISKGTY